MDTKRGPKAGGFNDDSSPLAADLRHGPYTSAGVQATTCIFYDLEVMENVE